jgi:UDPglucose 6-dehydrogenase
MIQTVSIIGLGKLGAPMAAAIAARRFRVIGVDADASKVEALNQKRPPVFEPGLPQLIHTASGRLSATQCVEDAVRDSDATFIVVATPSDPDGTFSLKYVLPVCEAIGRALRAKPGFHLVVLTSTVMPGTTAGAVCSMLEQSSGKKAGRGFGLCYNPEFIALGSVIRNFLNPDFLLIGESDPKSGALLEGLYRAVCENNPAVARMNFINAEVTKLAVNTYITTKISFANMMARICEQLPGADVDVVTSALGLDRRIGGKYLKGAISYGGPCFPRDNVALTSLAKRLGAPADIAQVTHKFNQGQITWLADLAEQFAGPGETVGILGLTYKADTDVVEQAPGLLLAQEFIARGIPVNVSDPAGCQNARRVLGDRARFLASPHECIADSHVVIVATPWPEFGQISAMDWAHHSPPRTVIDCWRGLPHLRNANGVRYICLGTGDSASSMAPVSVAAQNRSGGWRSTSLQDRLTAKSVEKSILGVAVNFVDYSSVLNTVVRWKETGSRQYICFATPHNVLLSQSDLALQAAQRKAALRLPDGIGIILAANLLGIKHRGRVSGPTLTLRICDEGRRHGLRHFFYGGLDGCAEETARRLGESYPGLQVAGAMSPRFGDLTPEEDAEVIREINATKADIIWIGLGSPKQEKWMASHLGLINCAAMISVGAALDFHAGRVPWAPEIVRRLGMEWAWRLAHEPRRLFRRYVLMGPPFLWNVALERYGLRTYRFGDADSGNAR